MTLHTSVNLKTFHGHSYCFLNIIFRPSFSDGLRQINTNVVTLKFLPKVREQFPEEFINFDTSPGATG